MSNQTFKHKTVFVHFTRVKYQRYENIRIFIITDQQDIILV